jgi:hypothetical protein
MKKAFFALPLLFLQLCAAAQGGPAEMADQFRANGKIYVVFAVILTIFAGIILYLVRLDRKMSRFEKHREA